MGVTVADWDNSGEWSIYLSNMYSHAGHRVVRLSDSVRRPDAGAARRADAGATNCSRAPRAAAGGKIGAVALAVNEGGWAWASLFYDLDNDGDKEIFVTNGNTQPRGSRSARLLNVLLATGCRRRPEAIERDAAPELVIGDQAREFRGSFSGYERDRLPSTARTGAAAASSRPRKSSGSTTTTTAARRRRWTSTGDGDLDLALLTAARPEAAGEYLCAAPLRPRAAGAARIAGGPRWEPRSRYAPAG